MSAKLLSIGVVVTGLALMALAVWISLPEPEPPIGEPVVTLPAPELRVPAPQVRKPAAPVLVRVAVSERARQVSLEVAAPYRLVSRQQTIQQGRRIARTTVTATARGLKIGSDEWAGTTLELVPESAPAVWIGNSLFRGRVRLHKVGDRVLAVNVLPLEEYVASVVDSEMPGSFPLEARKAQAIVARTFALYQRAAASAESLNELVSGVRSQKYLGYQYRDGERLLAGETAGGRQAAAETQGMVCTLHGAYFCTYYCACCGGRTVTGSEVFDDAAPALLSVPCGFCREARLYRWTAEVKASDVFSDLEKSLARRGQSVGRVRSLTPAGPCPPGRIPEFQIHGDRGTVQLTGFEVRQALMARGISSPRFTVAVEDGTFHFVGQGHGHGAGLCQWGARGLALAGHSARKIVEHYYPGAVVNQYADPDG